MEMSDSMEEWHLLRMDDIARGKDGTFVTSREQGEDDSSV